jgi:hypothetical protein
MNQRIAVRAIIHKEGKTLLLRRANGRQTQGNRTYHPSKNKKVHTAARRYFHSLGFCDAIEICKNKIKT